MINMYVQMIRSINILGYLTIMSVIIVITMMWFNIFYCDKEI